MAPQKPSSCKHSKKKQDPALSPVHDLKGPMTIGNQQYVPQPPNEKEKECIYKSQDQTKKAVRIPAKKTSVEASPSAAKKHSTKVSQKPPSVQKRKSEEEKEEDNVPNEESGDESPELIPPPQKKKKLTKKQVAVERTPEKILEETVKEEDIPISDHDRQIVAEFDATMGEASEDESPPHPGLDVATQGDDTDMEAGVEIDHENETAKDGGDQSKQTEAEQTLERNTPSAPDQTPGSGKSTGSTSFSREELGNLKV
ncbi:uncharacterized protein LOC127094634 [Lathyrus oleraceus]|uniref:uncharacterized protein LOC127094634 n=1 Tax=Pisum sativum TaxID=3888 RepID=UPI0021D38B20|nr:uncharacterized protein LOC127094634 [Pisum sativum]